MSQPAQDQKATNEPRAGKYLTFALGIEEYGIEIIRIKEIIGMMPITSVPQTDVFVKGVVNLRGKIIPVIDLRLKFGMEAVEYTERTCIVVVEIGASSKTVMVGLVVDSVSEVKNILDKEIEPPPAFGAKLSTQYIKGMAKKDDGVKILLDINKVLDEAEISALEKAA